MFLNKAKTKQQQQQKIDFLEDSGAYGRNRFRGTRSSPCLNLPVFRLGFTSMRQLHLIFK